MKAKVEFLKKKKKAKVEGPYWSLLASFLLNIYSLLGLIGVPSKKPKALANAYTSHLIVINDTRLIVIGA